MYDLHDAEVIGLALTSEAGAFPLELVLTVRSVVGQRRTLRFRGAIDWRLSAFGTQNVMFDFFEYDHLTLSEHIEAFFEVPVSWIEAIRSGEDRLYAFTSSVGMEGIVLAKELAIDEEA